MKIFSLYNLVNYSSEQIILFGLLKNYSSIKIESHNLNFKGISRYHNVIETCNKLFLYVDNIEDCDIVVLPYKFKRVSDPNFISLYNQCKIYNKILCLFFNDDYDKQIIPDNKHLKLYRTSLYKSTKLQNEYSLPAFSPDYFENNYLEAPKLNIGYCGHTIHGREKYLKLLSDCDLNTNFILRKGFWAPGMDKLVARREYIENIDNHLFTFCYRGAGNFSYRFYDVMMMGRIPILIKTDSVFPFEDKYDLDSIGIVIDEKDINNNLIETIKIFYKENNLMNVQKQNREIWENYYSPCGFLNNIIINTE